MLPYKTDGTDSMKKDLRHTVSVLQRLILKALYARPSPCINSYTEPPIFNTTICNDR